MKNRTTPKNLTAFELQQGKIFVFGSNEAGVHGKGAAKDALDFGAVMGQGYGLQGQTFAIPTKDKKIKSLNLEKISDYVGLFLNFAKAHPEKTFLVTEIGCGLAGYRPNDIASMFFGVKTLPNVHLPESFWAVLRKTVTLGEIIKVLNSNNSPWSCQDDCGLFPYLHAAKVVMLIPDNSESELTQKSVFERFIATLHPLEDYLGYPVFYKRNEYEYVFNVSKNLTGVYGRSDYKDLFPHLRFFHNE